MFVTRTSSKVTSERSSLDSATIIGEKLPLLWKNLARSIEGVSADVRVTRLIVWLERSITKKIQAQGMFVFVLEMWDTKLAITDAQLKRSKAENVMREDILRLYVKQRGSKIVSEAEELEECIEHAIEGVEEAILKGM